MQHFLNSLYYCLFSIFRSQLVYFYCRMSSVQNVIGAECRRCRMSLVQKVMSRWWGGENRWSWCVDDESVKIDRWPWFIDVESGMSRWWVENWWSWSEMMSRWWFGDRSVMNCWKSMISRWWVSENRWCLVND